MSDEVTTKFVFQRPLNGKELGELTSSNFERAGLSPPNNSLNKYRYLTIDGDRSKEASLEEATERVLQAGGGTVTIGFHELNIRVRYFSQEVAESEPQLGIGVWASQFKLWEDSTEASARRRTKQYTTFVRLLAETFDPLYAFGGIERNEKTNQLLPPLDRLKRGEVKRLFWLNVFSSTAVNQLGRDRVLSAPAWDVEELENGSVMVAISDNPVHPSKVWQDAGKRVGKHLSLKW